MGKIVVDTDVLIEIISRKNEVIMQYLIQNNLLEKLVITNINYMELVKGCNNKATLASLKKDISDLKIIDTTASSIKFASELMEKYHLSHNAHIADLIIASTCIFNNLTLLTLNTKDFRYIKELDLISHNLKPK